MTEGGVHHGELILLLLLVFVIGFGALARRLQTPYPIVLVIAGLLLSLAPGVPHVSLNPEFVFFVILPPLLYAAAFTTSWRDFRYHLVTIIFLAFGLVGLTVVSVAAVSRWILPGFDWRLGLLLGAVVSTTDAIAATSIARRVNLPRHIVDLLEGESLVNDASGLLALELTLGLLNSGAAPDLFAGASRFVHLVAGGIAIGLILGKGVHWIEQHVDDAPIEIILSVLTPCTAYLAAERVGASGVLATVACGLYVGRQSARFFSSAVRLEAYAVWNTLNFVLNGVVFLLIGLQLPSILAAISSLSLMQLVLRGGLFSVLVILLRVLWVYPGAILSYKIRRYLLHQPEPPPRPRETFVVGWTGMRGVVALAAAIALPATLANGQPLPQREVILFLTFCVIFVTLVLQGLTLPFVIRRLGVAEVEPANCEEQEARRILVRAALKELERIRREDSPRMRPIYDDLMQHYRGRLAELEGRDGEEDELTHHSQHYRRLAKQIAAVEHTTAIQLRDQNRINDEVLRTLQRELALAELRFASEESA